MNIVTLTFHNAVNYGAVLQAYALQHCIKSRNPECITGILDYRNEKVESKFRFFSVQKGKTKKQTVKKYVQKILMLRTNAVKKRKFNSFINSNIALVPFSTEKEKEDVINSVDRYIVGSDQVWNFELSGNDGTFFLDFVDDASKKCAYAPSIGKVELNQAEQEAFFALKDFKYLSVREKSAADMIESILGKRPIELIDPVFLLSKEDWKSVEKEYKGLTDRYVLVYHFSTNDREMIDFAYEYAKKNDCKLVFVQNSLKKYKNAKVIKDASPEEFLWLIDNAQCVITNSFHGTAFSIIFEKEFYSAINIVRSTRIKELLKLCGLENRIINSDTSMKKNNISWLEVNHIIDENRKKAYEFLDEIVQNP